MLTEKEGNADWSGAGGRSGQFFLFRTGHIGKTGVYLPFRDAGGGRFAKAKRKVRTPQGTVAGNACPPQGEDQSNRDEPVQSG